VNGHGRLRQLRFVGKLGFWLFLLKGSVWMVSLGFALFFTNR